MFKKITEKTTELMTKHPRLFSIAVGFAITLAVGTVMGTVYASNHQASILSLSCGQVIKNSVIKTAVLDCNGY